MKKLLVFFKGSSIHRTAFSSLSTLYTSIELSTLTLESCNQIISPVLETINTTTEPLHIIAIGDYSGRNNNEIRIELVCKNKFRNKDIAQEPSYKFNSYYENIYLKNPKLIPISFKLKNTGMGNNYCNLFSYKLNEYISKLPKDLKSKIYFDFLHVPSQFHATDTLAHFLGGTNTQL